MSEVISEPQSDEFKTAEIVSDNDVCVDMFETPAMKMNEDPKQYDDSLSEKDDHVEQEYSLGMSEEIFQEDNQDSDLPSSSILFPNGLDRFIPADLWDAHLSSTPTIFDTPQNPVYDAMGIIIRPEQNSRIVQAENSQSAAIVELCLMNPGETHCGLSQEVIQSILENVQQKEDVSDGKAVRTSSVTSLHDDETSTRNSLERSRKSKKQNDINVNFSTDVDPERRQERVFKWNEMVNNWDSWKNSNHLKLRIRKGIPDAFRGHVWSVLLGMEDILYEKEGLKLENATSWKKVNEKPSEYEKLLIKDVNKSCVDVLLRDLNRTFPESEMFMGESREGEKKLFRLLRAYAAYHPEVGYCQGLNFIAALVLMYIPDEYRAFWTFVAILEKDHIWNMYTQDMEGVKKRIHVVSKLFAKRNGGLYHWLEDNNTGLMFMPSWFMTLFASKMTLPFVVRIMDCFISEGDKILYRFAMALLKRLASGRVFKPGDDKMRTKAVKDGKKVSLLSLNMEEQLRAVYDVTEVVKSPDLLIKDAFDISLGRSEIEKFEREYDIEKPML